MSEAVVHDVTVRSSGEAELCLASSGKIHWSPSFEPGCEWITDDTVLDGEGRAVLGVNTLFARVGAAVVVVDPSSWRPDETALGPATLEPGRDLDVLLDAAGVDPDEVTHVAITHGHPDHFNGVLRETGELRFPNAEHVFPAADWKAVSDVARRLLEPAERAGALRLVSGHSVLCEAVRLLSAPGESDGHQVVRVDSDAERVYYLGDLVHFPVEFRNIDWAPVPGRDTAKLRESRLRIFSDAADRKSSLVFTHGRFSGWGSIEQIGKEAWQWSYL
jgi:glyoxylase-like metal-dependent hydrolase (beta-lactamase superfamily II)